MGSIDIPFLDERVLDNEQVIEAMVLQRPSYAAAYLSLRQADGTYRITHRGTGQYAYFFDTLVAHDVWEVERHHRLLKRRLKLESPAVASSVQYFRDRASATEALLALADD